MSSHSLSTSDVSTSWQSTLSLQVADMSDSLQSLLMLQAEAGEKLGRLAEAEKAALGEAKETELDGDVDPENGKASN